MAKGQRFSGQQAEITFLNVTDGKQVLPDLAVKNFNFTILIDTKLDEYLGAQGQEVTEFFNGYEFSCDHDPRAAVTLVDFMGLVIAKAKRQIDTVFAARAKFKAPGSGQFDITFADVHWESPSGSMAGQKEFFSMALKGKGTEATFKRR
jgi:hypothetical protein